MKKLIQVLSAAILFAFGFNAKAQGPYTYNGTGNITTITSWKNSGGVTAGAFTESTTWNIFPASGVTVLGAHMTFGDNSTIVIGDGVHNNQFATGSNFQFRSVSHAKNLSLTVANHATFYVTTANFFNQSGGTNGGINSNNCTFATGSNVVYNYSGGNTTMCHPASYSNVSVLQPANFNGDIIAVRDTLNLSSTLDLVGGSCILKGIITGSGNIAGDDGYLTINSPGSIGVLNFSTNTFIDGQVLDSFKIISGSAILNSNLLISGVSAGALSSVFDQSGGSLDLNGFALTLDIDNNATFGSSSSHVIKGSTFSSLIINSPVFANGGGSTTLYMDQSSPGTSNALGVLILNSNNSLSLGNQLNITDSISPTIGYLTTNDNLTLIADQTVVGKVGRIGVSAAIITGNVTSQVWHNPPSNQTNWMLMGAAGIKNATFADWNSNFVITCPTGCNYSSSNGSAFNSVQIYTENSAPLFDDASHYSAIGGFSSPITIGQGYWVYLGTANPGASIPGELISIKGIPQTGSISYTLRNSGGGDLVNHGYNLVANPYPSPISWAKVMAKNIGLGGGTENNIYAYSATYGDYMSYNANSGASNPAAGTYSIGDIIPAGLGFYVQTASNSQSIGLDEYVKCADPTHQMLFREGNSANTSQSLSQSTLNHNFSLHVTGTGTNDSWTTLTFNAKATLGTDGFDAMAIGYNGVVKISTSTASTPGNDYAINGLPDLNQNYSIPVKIVSGTTAQYQINSFNLQNMLLGTCLILHDNHTGINYDLRSGPITVTINDTEKVARFVLNITVNQLAITTTKKQATCSAKNDGLITAVGNSAGPWNYIWKDAQGTILKTSLNKTSADTLTGLNNGVYSVEVNTQGSCDAALQSFTITAPSAATSLFTVPTQINAGSTVTFSNSSTGAKTYAWSFGDGNTANQITPSYVYSNPGTYTVTLVANNTACNETSTSKQVIVVDATTGIKQAVAGSGDIFVSKDETGNYLQFNYAAQTKVNITVYNVLGQTLLSNAGLNVVTDKIYLNLNDSKNQVLYVTITDLTTNIQTTKKFVNN